MASTGAGGSSTNRDRSVCLRSLRLRHRLRDFTRKAIQQARANAVAGGISAYLNLAHTYSSRGNYNKATSYCNAALALDPTNAEAKSARAQISTTAGGWGMRRGRR